MCVLMEDRPTQSQDYGFGHRVYKVKDPRGYYPAELGRAVVWFGHDKYYDIAVEMERVIEEKTKSKEFIQC